MIKEAEACLAGPGKAGHVVHVHDLAVEEVAGKSGDALAVWRQHAPALARKKLPLVLPDVDPVEPDARNEGAVRHSQSVRGALAKEVELVIPNEVRAFPIAV